MTERTQKPSVSLGNAADSVSEAVARLESGDVVTRIWALDHTVWRDDPKEIADRLGWLTVIGDMRKQLPELTKFVAEIREASYTHVVLLGMGGSSLGPEVIRQAIGVVEGHPELIVLDSTVPSRVRSVTEQIDPSRTLFLVSSKSGSTVEPLSFYKHFRRAVEAAVGSDEAGARFVAITDPGSPLAQLAIDDGFRRTFENPPDMGGRYSVLSYFGLVPAALMGVDLPKLLDRASGIARDAVASVDVQHNAAAWLGALLAATAANGRDKLTLVLSPKIAGFGLWVEQLLAESTGKEGKGIVPVTGEPLLDDTAYGEDRVFVYLRVEGDDNAALDVATERLAAVGHPTVRLDLADTYDIGAEFFRWEFATAVAGMLLGVQPFDQPDVQAAKDATGRVLSQLVDAGNLPETESEGSIPSLLEQSEPGDYVALMAYVEQTNGVDGALLALRKQVMESQKLATTMGYGPRFLHSTGQLHKGGPTSGLFVQFVDNETELDIPGEEYGFRTLVSAQAMGDYQALRDAGRRVVRISLGEDAEGGLLRLLATL